MDRLEDQPKRIQALGGAFLSTLYIDYNWRLVSCLGWTMSKALLEQGGLAARSAHQDVQGLWQVGVGVQKASATSLAASPGNFASLLLCGWNTMEGSRRETQKAISLPLYAHTHSDTKPISSMVLCGFVRGPLVDVVREACNISGAGSS